MKMPVGDDLSRVSSLRLRVAGQSEADRLDCREPYELAACRWSLWTDGTGPSTSRRAS